MASSKKKRPPRIAATDVRPLTVPPQRPGRPGGARDANRQERLKVLCDAGLRLFLERGIESVRIDDIVDAAGVAKGSFYRYFADKTALVETLFAPVTDAARRALTHCQEAIVAARDRADLLRGYQSLGFELAMVIGMHRHVVQLYLQERRGPAVGARVPIRRMAAELEQGAERLSAEARRRGLLRPFPARVSGLAVIGAAEQLLFAWFSGEDLGDPAALPTLLTSLIMEGMRPRES
jgi:AcrR family transcriptional regulator